MNSTKSFLIFTLPLIAMLVSCSSTPESRIQKNPEAFLSLSTSQQSLVKAGKIDTGMNESAVYLAMGSPDSKITGNKEGRTYTRWDYSVLTPVYTTGYGGFYGGGPYYGRGAHYGAAYMPTVTYVPTRGSSVYFKKGVVAGWEQKQY